MFAIIDQISHFTISMQHLLFFPLLYPYLINFIQLKYSTTYN